MGGYGGFVADLGAPISYLVLAEGTPVHDAGGAHIGEVADVLADETVDIFHGLIVRLSVDGDLRFAAAEQIADLHERGVLLGVDRYALIDPAAEPVAREAVAEDLGGDVPPGVARAREWFRRHR